MARYGLIFPGQGSQHIGMLSELAVQYPVIERTFAEASDVLGYDVWQLVQSDPDNRLNQTEYTQPALLTASVALYRCIEDSIEKPVLMAGHSLGEYSALVCAGALNFADAVALVRQRGQFMQAAVPQGSGAMAAVIGLDDAAIEKACAEAAGSDVVAPVNYNSPGQVVIAGSTEAVARAGELCKAAGAKRVLPLPVSVPSHCALMKPAADQLYPLLNRLTVSQPGIPVLHNVDVSEAQASSVTDKLAQQLYSPVQWTQTMLEFVNQGVTTVYEFGPGKVLTGLAKRIDKQLDAKAVNEPASMQTFLQEQE